MNKLFLLHNLVITALAAKGYTFLLKQLVFLLESLEERELPESSIIILAGKEDIPSLQLIRMGGVMFLLDFCDVGAEQEMITNLLKDSTEELDLILAYENLSSAKVKGDGRITAKPNMDIGNLISVKADRMLDKLKN